MIFHKRIHQIRRHVKQIYSVLISSLYDVKLRFDSSVNLTREQWGEFAKVPTTIQTTSELSKDKNCYANSVRESRMKSYE